MIHHPRLVIHNTLSCHFNNVLHSFVEKAEGKIDTLLSLHFVSLCFTIDTCYFKQPSTILLSSVLVTSRSLISVFDSQTLVEIKCLCPCLSDKRRI